MDKCFSSILDRLRLAIPDAPVSLLESYAQSATKEFFTKSGIWVERISLNTSSDSRNYTLSSSADIVKIHKVTDSCGNTLSEWEQPYPRMITLHCPVNGGIIVEASLASGSNPPSDIVEANADVIESLAFGKLFMLPSKTFTNYELAVAHRNIADAAIAHLKRDMLRDMKPYRKTYGCKSRCC